MQSVYDQKLFLLVKLNGLISCVFIDSHRKPFLEIITAVKDLRKKEVEKRPKLS